MAAPVDDREFGFVNMIICDCELVAWGGWVGGWVGAHVGYMGRWAMGHVEPACKPMPLP